LYIPFSVLFIAEIIYCCAEPLSKVPSVAISLIAHAASCGGAELNAEETLIVVVEAPVLDIV
jgi:hypothetical protein